MSSFLFPCVIHSLMVFVALVFSVVTHQYTASEPQWCNTFPRSAAPGLHSGKWSKPHLCHCRPSDHGRCSFLSRVLRDAKPSNAIGLAPPRRRLSAMGTLIIVPLVLFVQSLGVWLTLPNLLCWLARTFRLGYVIQFARRPPRYNCVLFTSV